jgi:hypothetical protein
MRAQELYGTHGYICTSTTPSPPLTSTFNLQPSLVPANQWRFTSQMSAMPPSNLHPMPSPSLRSHPTSEVMVPRLGAPEKGKLNPFCSVFYVLYLLYIYTPPARHVIQMCLRSCPDRLDVYIGSGQLDSHITLAKHCPLVGRARSAIRVRLNFRNWCSCSHILI